MDLLIIITQPDDIVIVDIKLDHSEVNNSAYPSFTTPIQGLGGNMGKYRAKNGVFA